MLLLTSTSDLIQLITSAAATVKVHASYADNTSGTISVGRVNTNISTATTTTVVPAPGSGVQRNIKALLIRNSHASLSDQITILHTDGTTVSEFFSAVLAAGEFIQFTEGIGFQVFTSAGALKTSVNQGSNTLSSDLSSVVLGADVTNNNATANTIADVAALSFPVTAGNKYYFRFVIPYTSAATTTGSRWAINGPTTTMLSYRSAYTLTATSETVNGGVTAYDTPAASNASSLTTGNVAIIEGVIIPSANGTVIARFASEISSSAIVAKAGAVCFYQQVA